MMKKRGFRTFVAALALASMLLENTATVFAVEGGSAEQAQSYESTDVTVEVSQEDTAGAEEETDVSDEQPAQEQQPEEQTQGSNDGDFQEESREETPVEPVIEITTEENGAEEPSESQPEEEAQAVSSVEAVDGSRLEISGNTYIPLYIDTDQLNSKDTFRLNLETPDGASYDGLLNSEMSKANGNIYYLDNLQNRMTRVSVQEASDGVTVEYTVRGDGYPQITLISAEEPEPEKEIRITEDGKAIEGSGLTELTVTFDNSELAAKLLYSLYVSTGANVTYDGRTVDGSISGLDKNTKTISLSDLDYQAFSIYVAGDTTNTIASDYSIDSVDNSAVRIKVYNTNEEQKVIRDYTYEDEFVNVTATLQRADALPDDAYFSVTKVEPESREYDYDAYMDALNENAEEGASYDESNTLLYDIAFYTDETKTEEIEPEEGSVAVSIQFKKGQLSEEATSDNVSMSHIAEGEDGLSVSSLDVEVSPETDQIEFSTDEFSIFVLQQETSNVYVSTTTVSGDDTIQITVKIDKSTLPENSNLKMYLDDTEGSQLQLKAIKRGKYDYKNELDMLKLVSDRSASIFGEEFSYNKFSNAFFDELLLYGKKRIMVWDDSVQAQVEAWDPYNGPGYLGSLNDIGSYEVTVEFLDNQLSAAKEDNDQFYAVQIKLKDDFYSSEDASKYKPFENNNIESMSLVDSTMVDNNANILRFSVNNASDIAVFTRHYKIVTKTPYSQPSALATPGSYSKTSDAKEDFTKDNVQYSSLYQDALNNNGTSTLATYPYSINYLKNAYENAAYNRYHRNSAMGIAGDFHLVAFESVYGLQHIYGNVLAKNLIGPKEGFGSYRDELSYVQNLFDDNISYNGGNYFYNIGNLGGGGNNDTFVFGDKEGLYHKTNDGNYFRRAKVSWSNDLQPVGFSGIESVIQDDNSASAPFIDFTDVYNQIVAYSNSLKALEPNVSDLDIDIRQTGNSSYNKNLYCNNAGDIAVVNLKGSDLNPFFDNIPFKIYGRPGQAIVINVDCEGKNYISTGQDGGNGIKYYIVNGDTVTEAAGGEQIDQNQFGQIIWNFYNYPENAYIYFTELKGQVIAPNATVDYHGGEGNVIAKNIYVSNESHRMDYTAVDPITGEKPEPEVPEEPEEPGVDTPATVEIPVSKSFAAGDTWPTGSTYTFELEGENTETVTTTSTEEHYVSCYTTTAYIHQTPQTGRGDYRIQVSAKHNSQKSDGHTSNQQTVKVVFNQPVNYVSCNANGATRVSENGTNEVVFTTTYTQNATDNIGFGDLVVTSDAGLAIVSAEVSDGHEAVLVTDTVENSETVTTRGTAGTVTIDSTGTGSIGPLTFQPANEEGPVSYYYTLSENDPGSSDIIKDPKVYEIRIDVTTTIDGKDKTATAEILYKNADGEYVKLGDDSFTFENSISKGYTSAFVTLNVNKSYEGDWTGKTFTFNISGSEGAPMPKKDGSTVPSISTDSNVSGNTQTLTFGTIEFEADSSNIGEKVPYTYTITEVPGTDEGIEYDPTVYTIKLNTWTEKDGNNYIAKVEKVVGEDGETEEDYSGETVSFENKIATGDLTVEKTVTGWWRITCERMGDEASVPDPVFSSNHTHRKAYCGDPSHWKIDLDENGVPIKLTEIDTPYPEYQPEGYNKGELPCTIYTDDTYETVRDIRTIEQGETIYWTSQHDGIDVQWHHFGTVESTGSFDFTVSKDNKYYYLENGEVKESATPVTFSLEAGEELTFTGLPVGDYTVTEIGSKNIYTVSVKDGEGTSLQTSASGGNTSATVKVSSGEDPSTVNFVNHLTAGTIRIKKNVNPNTVDYSGKNFYVLVTGPNNYTKLLTLTLDEEGSASAAITDLPVGTYLVQETDENGTPLAQNTPYNIHMWGYGAGDNWTNDASVELTGGSDVTVRISNTIGSLQVNKTFIPTNSGTHSDTFYFALTDGTYYYDVEGNAYTERHVESLSFTDITQSTTQSLLFKNLPLDRKYSVREQMAVTENGTTTYVDADGNDPDFNYTIQYETEYWKSPDFYTVPGADNIEAMTGDKGKRPLVNVNITNTEKKYSEINIFKGGYQCNLGGVTFELTRNGKPVVAELVNEGLNNTYNFVSADGTGEATKLVTGTQGQVGIHQLPWGEYELREVATAEGYVVSEDAWFYV
ncbi:MAG: hypothetical protein IJ873_04095, partial [Lachnospiraceae bacterium]|nr:hypothetical protein [Lachnospiraceae bacterium]